MEENAEVQEGDDASDSRTEQDEYEREQRIRKATEKGQQYALNRVFEIRATAGASLRSQITRTRKLLDGTVTIQQLEAERDKLDACRDKLNDIHESYHTSLTDPEEINVSNQWFDIRDREHFQCHTKLNEKIQSLMRENSEVNSERSSKSSGRSRSSRNSRNSLSSVRSKRAQAAAKVASLQVELEFLAKEQEQQAEHKKVLSKFLAKEQEQQAEHKRLQMLKEIAKAKAEEAAIRAVENEEAIESKHESMESVASYGSLNLPPKVPNPGNPDGSAPNTAREVEKGELATALELMVEQQKVNLLPAQEPPVFSGNCFDYPKFTSSFDAVIETKVKDPKQRLYYLNQYTSGEANEVISGLVTLNSPDAYYKAREILKERFGHPYRVSQVYKERLKDWPPIKEGNGAELQRLSDFLAQCEEAMKTVKYMEGLNSEEMLRRISAKLPSYVASRWCRHAHKILKSEERLATFHDFVQFIKKEAELATDPVYSFGALKEERKRENKVTDKDIRNQWYNKKGRSYSSFSTTAACGTAQTQMRSQPSSSTMCPSCLRNHELDCCPDFKKKSLEERKDFVKKGRLCFACFSPGHMSKECLSRKTCQVCQKSHPTSLHDYSRNVPKESASHPHNNATRDAGATSSCTSICNAIGCGNVSLMIVPVWVYHKDNPQKKLMVYAVLDPASNGTFINEETMKKLRIKGTETQLQLNTMHGSELVPTQRVRGLMVKRTDERVDIELPQTYSRAEIPSSRQDIPRPETAANWPHLTRIADKLQPYQDDIEVGLLIGSNCPKAVKPKEIIPGRSDDPYAVRTLLGWGIIGPVDLRNKDENPSISCNRIAVKEIGHDGTSSHNFVLTSAIKEVIQPSVVRRMFEMDFSETKNASGLSQEDRQFMAKVSKGIRHRADNHYEMPLPFRIEDIKFPDNKKVAAHRLRQLQSKFKQSEKYKKDYVSFVGDMIKNGYAEEVPTNEHPEEGKVWYLPHHGVYHPRKPGKIRVVFDCSAEYLGNSLNQHLLPGPDLTNKLVGVLSRFRKEPVAFMGDIEGMFNQVKVTEDHKDFLRFLWWENGDTSKEPQIYRMTVHLFGAASSPGCSNFALKKTADDNEQEIGADAATFLRDDFYVDDGLRSLPTITEAVQLIIKTQEMCRRGGFRLHKFVSNKKEVVEAIPSEDRANGPKAICLKEDIPPVRALGVHWCIESDTFLFRIVLKDLPFTRRGILSTVSSIYDPLGFLAPVLLTGKRILQELCRDKVDWDDPIPNGFRPLWEKWRMELRHLDGLSIPRCFKPEGFGQEISAQLHHFSDASSTGYGQCTYLRLENGQGKVHCSLVMGKSRVSPLAPVTIPRLELTAAVVSIRVSDSLRQELRYEDLKEVFWTDSKVVLGYIKNDTRRFRIFVANRVQEIRSQTSPDQWRYVDSKTNPADDASRGLSAKEIANPSRWINGPEFLWRPEEQWPQSPKDEDFKRLLPDDPEIKEATILSTHASRAWSLENAVAYFSDWHRATRAVALCLRYRRKLHERTISKGATVLPPRKDRQTSTHHPAVSVDELRQAEVQIIKSVQDRWFQEQIAILEPVQNKTDHQARNFATERKSAMKKTSSLYRLDPYLDSNGVLRVGGRISRSNLPSDEVFPVILPRKSHVTELVIKHHHEKVKHQGRGMTLNEIRSSGFWIIGGNSAVAYYISRCVVCRKVRGVIQGQKMADLPEDRLEPAPPFTHCAVDYFGPWFVKEGRKEMKRYGVLFTCMASRAIHLEVSNSLDTDSFIKALRRFICRRGPVRQLRSDRGTNFVGAKRELREAVRAMDRNQICSEMLKSNCDWVEFKMNPPSSSHMGGIWERQIRTVRSVLNVILEKSGRCLDDESLRTFMCEAEAVVNSRPLTVDNLSDPKSPAPLSPSHLLTMKTKLVLAPPGIFQPADIYSRKRWRRVQHLSNEFWQRWRKEYLQTLQERSKWLKPKRNLQPGDIVLINEDNVPRNRWNLARVTETHPDRNGLVRKVTLTVADPALSEAGKRLRAATVLERPIHKLVLLAENETQESNDGSPGFRDGEPPGPSIA